MYQQAASRSVESMAIEKYAPLVRRIAHHMMARMPASVQVDDLLQAGMVGLLEASRNFDGSKGASFETFAGIRIRGAIVDEMRRGDWAPRSVHRNARRIQETLAQLERSLGREPSASEMAEALGASLDDYFRMLQDSTSTRLFSYEESVDDDGNPEEGGTSVDSRLNALSRKDNPLHALQVGDQRQRLVHAIGQLKEREQLVLSLYYDEELNLKEIGEVLGVSESRVSQIHSQVAMKLRRKLNSAA